MIQAAMLRNDDLRTRTKKFALSAIAVFGQLPRTEEARILGKQMVRSATSVGAHYREAHRAKSNADFFSKIEGALQELDESGYWMELLIESALFDQPVLHDLFQESDELTRIFVTIIRNAKSSVTPNQTSHQANDRFILHPSSFILL